MAPGRSNLSPDGLVVGLDCSTTGTKAIAFDASGSIAAEAHEALALSTPRPGWFEQDSADWWDTARKALRAVTRQVDPLRICALAIANQRETFVPLARSGKPLRPAILWLDERCRDEVASFASTIGLKRLHRITGKPVDYAPVVYRLAWMKKHESALYRRVGAICDVHAYLTLKTTGFLRTSWASADPFGIFDLRRKRWSPVILGALGLDAQVLPEIYSPGTVLGTLTQSASAATGLTTSTLVVAGGGDGQCAGLGAGILSSRRAYLNLGTAAVAGVYNRKFRTSRAFRTMSGWTVDGYYYECSLRAGTLALDWFIDNLLRTGRSDRSGVYSALEKEALHVPVGSAGVMFLPYLCGAMNPHWDSAARGAFVGLSSSHGRGHMYRAILEGIAFEQAVAIDAVEKAAGIRVGEFVAIGGGAASTMWRSIIASVTGRPLRVLKSTQASALGAAMAAAVGAGWYGTFEEAASGMTSIRGRTLPDPEARTVYTRMMVRYQRLYPALRTLSN